MPESFTYETAISVDHETGDALIDTSVRSIATQLLRCGFLETTKADSKPYRRFRGNADQVKFRKPKGSRSVKGAALQKTMERGNPGLESTISYEDG